MISAALIFAAMISAVLILPALPACAQVAEFKLDPDKTTVRFILDAVLHKVDGTFRLQPSALQLDMASGGMTGEISVDARSGVTGNSMRDRKMHKDVLESDRYPDIQFHPDRISGTVERAGKSSVMVHGIFRIHGVDREVTVPASVNITADSWAATIHFTIPYAKWGMKNPSNLFLHVSDSVEIDLAATGNIVQHAAATHDSTQ